MKKEFVHYKAKTRIITARQRKSTLIDYFDMNIRFFGLIYDIC
jgi:hypothetical protein